MLNRSIVRMSFRILVLGNGAAPTAAPVSREQGAGGLKFWVKPWVQPFG